MKELIKYLIIGIIQGISEILPISSSAHLIIVEEFLLMNDDNLTLEVFLHLASFIAVVFFLRKELICLIKGFFKYTFLEQDEYRPEFKLCWFVVISTIPVVVFTLLFKKQITSISNNVLLVGILLIINGLILLITTGIKGKRSLKEMNIKDALIIGIFECMGLFPGISRSGSCLYGAYTRKIEKNDAARYAFLLFLPAVVGAFVLEISNLKEVFYNENLWVYIITFIVTAITTYLAFRMLQKVIKNNQIKYFGFYCIIIGAISILTKLIK